MIYQGKFVRFNFDGKKLFNATSCSIDISTKLEEIATKDTDGTVTVPSNYTWSGSAEALFSKVLSGDTTHVGADQLIALQLANTEFGVDFTTGTTGDFVFSGSAYLENVKVTADTGTSVKVSFSFKGNGNLTQDVV
jgi:hypothetical protein